MSGDCAKGSIGIGLGFKLLPDWVLFWTCGVKLGYVGFFVVLF